MDFMLVRLDGVPAGAELVFRYGPTWRVRAWWALSLLTLAGLLGWGVRPAPFERADPLGGPARVGAPPPLRGWGGRPGGHPPDRGTPRPPPAPHLSRAAWVPNPS